MPVIWHIFHIRCSRIGYSDVFIIRLPPQEETNGNESRGDSLVPNGVSLVRQDLRVLEESESSWSRKNRAARLRFLYRGTATYAARSQADPEEQLVLREHGERPAGIGQR